MKSQAEEFELLASENFQAQRQYVLWYGFQSKSALQMLAQCGPTELVRLQHRFYASRWHDGAMRELYRRGLASPPTEEDERRQRRAFENWLYVCRNFSRGNEKEYGRMQLLSMAFGAVFGPVVSEEEQLRWFEEGNLEKIVSYGGLWKGKAAVRFWSEGPEEALYYQLHYRLLKREEDQLALAQRDIRNGENNLIWFYFSSYRAFPSVQKLLQEYDQNLWRRMLIINYGWEYEFERKFGSLQNWQEKLDACFPMLAHCPIEDIRQALHRIE